MANIYLSNSIASAEQILDLRTRLSQHASDLLFKTPQSTLEDYQSALEAHQALAESDVCIVPSLEDQDSLHKVLHAMLLKKPIVLLRGLALESKMDPFASQVIMGRLSKIFVLDLTQLDDEDSISLLRNLTKDHVNYVITKHETILIRAKLRARFRHLLAATI